MKRYLVKTAKDNLTRLNHFRIRQLRINEDLEFYTDRRNLEAMQKVFELEYVDRYRNAWRSLLRKHLITVIGAVLIMLALINQSQTIRRIEFTDPDTHNEEVLAFLNQYFRRIGPFTYLKGNLTTINNHLRSEFYQYEWIGVRRKGAILYLDIKEIVNNPLPDDKTPGSLYAKESGIVKRYHVESGVVLVQEEVYVEKGTLLISGEIVHYNNRIEQVRAKGYVIAEVLKYYDFKIPKTRSEVIKTGKMQSSKEYFLFSFRLNQKTSFYPEEEVQADDDVLYFGFLHVRKNYHYEIKEVRTDYSPEEAVRYAKTMVTREFRKNKVSKFEKIVYNDLVKIEVGENFYHIRLIVKTYQNIAEFVPRKN
jgi:sporulation protein YqfD